MSSSGAALCACSAANSPAPPEPRIRMSVCRRSRSTASSEHAREEDQGDERRDRRRHARQLLLPVMPRQVLDHQQAQPAQHVNREQKNEPALGHLDQRLIAPAQEAFEPCLAADGETEREEMQRQENRQRQTGQAMHQRRDPQQVAAVVHVPRGHHSTTAATARSPSTSSTSPKALARTPAPRSLSGDHSVSTLRTPIETCTAAATTNT